VGLCHGRRRGGALPTRWQRNLPAARACVSYAVLQVSQYQRSLASQRRRRLPNFKVASLKQETVRGGLG
jgi:hypothetical protein